MLGGILSNNRFDHQCLGYYVHLLLFWTKSIFDTKIVVQSCKQFPVDWAMYFLDAYNNTE